jgi:hypothetical protein
MLLFLLSPFSSPDPLSIIEQNYLQISSDNSNKPILVKLFDPFCSYCKAFAPIWQSFCNLSRFSDRVVFGETNCMANARFCNRLKAPGYPSVVFIDVVRNFSIPFEGAMTIAGIESFLEKQLTFPLKIIENSSSLDLSVTNISSLFVLEFEDTLGREVEVVRGVAEQVRADDCVFVGYRSGRADLRVFQSRDVSVGFEGNWSEESVSGFVRAHLYCELPPFTGRAVDEFSKKGELFVVVFLVPEMYEEVRVTVRGIRSRFRIFYEVFEEGNWIVQLMGVKRDRLPVFAVLDPKETRYAFGNGNDSTSVQDWLNELDPTNIKWEGPGSGFFAELRARIEAVVGAGGLLLYLILFCILIVLVMFGFMIRDCYWMFQPDFPNQKKE